MESKDTRFNYMYQNLRNRIINGQLQPGHQLPSSRRLCEEYQVGIRTVTDVLNALKKEGLIDIQPRRAARICSHEGSFSVETAARKITAHGNGLLQLYQTMTHVLPPLLTFSAQKCCIIELPHYAQAQKVCRYGSRVGGWRPMSALFQDLLNQSKNPLFIDIYSAIEVRSCLNFFIEDQAPITGLSLSSSFSNASWIIHMLEGKDALTKMNQLTDMYVKMTSAVEESLDRLSKVYPDVEPQNDDPFTWNAVRGRDYYYTRIVRDLVNKIGIGVYPPNTYLPSEARLAQEYGVFIFTVRNALAQMERLGFSKTYNVKGTMALIPNDNVVFRSLQTPTTRQDTMMYLYSLQFLALAIYPAALLAGPHFTEEDTAALQLKFEVQGAIPLGDIIERIIERLELEPFRVILLELGKLAQWGYYFSFYRNESTSTNLLNQKSLSAFRCMQYKNIRGFAEGLSDCYCHILKAVRKFVIEKYEFTEARDVPIPDIYGIFGNGSPSRV